jgi:hypothetical protein
MTRFGPMADAGAASPAAPPSRVKHLRDANRDTPGASRGLLLTVIPCFIRPPDDGLRRRVPRHFAGTAELE